MSLFGLDNDWPVGAPRFGWDTKRLLSGACALFSCALARAVSTGLGKRFLAAHRDGWMVDRKEDPFQKAAHPREDRVEEYRLFHHTQTHTHSHPHEMGNSSSDRRVIAIINDSSALRSFCFETPGPGVCGWGPRPRPKSLDSSMCDSVYCVL